MKKKLRIIIVICSLVGMYIAKTKIDKSNNDRTRMLDNLDDGTIKNVKAKK